jgi:hypothetical protein
MSTGRVNTSSMPAYDVSSHGPGAGPRAVIALLPAKGVRCAVHRDYSQEDTNMGIFSVKPRQLPSRIAAGAFILNSGIGKLSADEATAAQLHGFAAGAYPFLGKVKPKDFVRFLAVSEVALGTALLIPFVPDVLAGAGLTAFSGGLLGLYARTPGLRKEGSPFPTQDGIALAKDVWMAGIGVSLLVDGITEAASSD